MRGWFENGWAWLWHCLTDGLLLSVCRVLFWLWIFLTLRDLAIRVFWPNTRPPFGEGSAALIILVWGLSVFWFIWRLAELILDKTRQAHRAAYEVELPRLRASHRQLEHDLTQKDRELTQTCQQLYLTAKDLAAKQSANEDNLHVMTRLQLDLDKTKADLRTALINLDQARTATAEARTRQAQSEHKAATAEEVASERVLKELQVIKNNLNEYEQQLTATRITAHQTIQSASPPLELKDTSGSKNETKTEVAPPPSKDNNEPHSPKRNYV